MEIHIINLFISILYTCLIIYVIVKTNEIEKHINLKKFILSFVPSLILMTLVSYSSIIILKMIGIFLITFYISNIIYRIKSIKSIMYAIIFLSFYFVSELITHFIFIKAFGIKISDIGSSGLIYCLYSLMSFVLTSVMLNFDKSISIYNIFNKSLDLKAKISTLIILVILLFVIFINILVINKTDGSSLTYLLSIGSFIASMLLCMALFYFINIIIDTTNTLDLTKEYNNKLELYNKTMQELIDTQRRTVHEFNNKMTVLNGYIKDKRFDDAEFFISKSLKETKNIDNTMFKNIKNSGLKSLLLFKYAEIKDKNIGFEVMVNKRIESLIIDDDDLCKIIGIFLDNAIEATVLSEKPFISIGIVKIEQSISITIMNSIPNEYLDKEANFQEKIYQVGYSKKGYNRGFGLSIAKDLIDRYKELSCVTEIQNGFFIQDLIVTRT